MITDYHAKYFAYELTKRHPSDSLEKLAGAVASAQVDLNPHQVDAALFAFHSPLSKGALLADEVGLGKTIEAGLVISQRWAERKKRILIITPSNLRKQWQQEMSEKFFLPCTILETRNYNQMIKLAHFRPFEIDDSIIICSYQFARNKASDVANTPWDLVVIDEAHRLRNVYKPSNIIANTLKGALGHTHKLLLTATPLQNSLLELFGLVSFIDEHTFGDLQSFREQFLNLNQEEVFDALKARLKPVCHRTLRRQLNAYVPYTSRFAIVEEFVAEESEDKLYSLVSDYLQRPNLQALPAGQRTLMTLVLRKLLASSTFAIAGALNTISQRLKDKLKKHEPVESLEEELDKDYEALDETAEEWPEESVPEPISDADRAALEAEIADLDEFSKLASGIDHNAKGRALVKALGVAFAKTKELGGPQKAIIFTESRRTQDYLLRVLADSSFADGIVLFNGSNADERSRQIYAAWFEKHQGTDRVSGSRTADMRSALVDYFREEGRIMIATEAGAEGINLQFCSLVINYDLPWNPQRIEQRIGRCHRYGQEHDVVVVNFLNKKNEADQRVYQLLSEKFKLFDGVFGASDEVLGAIGSGVDFEKRIAAIYQDCRRPDDIKSAFDQLQLELNFEISETITTTRKKLLEHFDDEVREKLRLRDKDARTSLNRYERMLIDLTNHELAANVSFVDDSSFLLNSNPFLERDADIPLGLYELPRRSGHAHLYRLNHPLAEAVIDQAKTRQLPLAEITLDYTGYSGKVTMLESILGQSGWLSVSVFAIDALDQLEEYILFSGVTDNGLVLDGEQSRRLLSLSGSVSPQTPLYEAPAKLTTETKAAEKSLLEKISARNGRFFEAELKKLDGWADDQIASSEKALRDVKKRIRDLRNEASKASELSEQARFQAQIGELERTKRRLRQDIFSVEDRILAQRDELVGIIRGKLKQKVTSQPLFSLRWSLS
jgi:superfamily II DNA or RNA helicase